MKSNPMLYGIIGLLVGGFATVLVVTSLVNSNNTGAMQMMGLRANSSTFQMMGNIDRHFIEQMIPHHESAIEMARLAQESSKRPEIKTLADSIIKSQSAEIEKMKRWYKDWYGSGVPAYTNTGTGMMHGGTMGDVSDIDSLKKASDFDKAFLDQMIPHHQMAVIMANMLLQGTNRLEMKQLGQEIISAQTKEINEMRSWYQSWY